MAFTIDQKWVVTAGVAAGGALTALSASDVVPPQVAAFSAAGLLILGMFGVYLSPNARQQRRAVDDHVAANPQQALPLPPIPQPPPSTSNPQGRRGLP